MIDPIVIPTWFYKLVAMIAVWFIAEWIRAKFFKPANGKHVTVDEFRGYREAIEATIKSHQEQLTRNQCNFDEHHKNATERYSSINERIDLILAQFGKIYEMIAGLRK